MPASRIAGLTVSLSLTIGCVWVILAAITAILPMRRQYAPGITLLGAAPFLLGFIGYQHGPWWVIGGTLAIVSMFRRPLRYMGRKALGLPIPDFPRDDEEGA